MHESFAGRVPFHGALWSDLDRGGDDGNTKGFSALAKKAWEHN
jgi:hypothetical protein